MAPLKAMKPMKGMKVATAGLKTKDVKAVVATTGLKTKLPIGHVHWNYGKSISKAQLFFCNGICKDYRPDYQFLEEELVAVMAGTEQPQQRMCVHCYMQDRKDLSEAKVYKCNTCEERKHLRDFSPFDQKEWLKGVRYYYRWVCYECRFPQCETCKKRPLHAVKHNAYIDGKYYCIRCKYPECAGGCGKRPKSTK